MLKKIAYIIICCVLSGRAFAQTPADINQRLDSITKSIDIIIKDEKVSGTCREKIKRFRKGFSQKDTATFKGKNIKSLIQHADKFMVSLAPKGKFTCTDKQIKKLVSRSHELIRELKKINISVVPVNNQAINKNDSATIKPTAAIQITDSSILKPTVLLSTVDSLKDDDKNKNGNTPGIVPDQSGIQYSQGSTLFIAVAVLLGLIMLVSILYFKKAGDYKTISKQMEELKNERKNQPGTKESVDDPGKIIDPVAQRSTEPLKEASNEAIKEDTAASNEQTDTVVAGLKDVDLVMATQVKDETNLVTSGLKQNPYFLCEVMMTAGPRKKYMNEENADKDLGEDVFGFVSNSNEVLIWLLDGTSDLHCLKNPVTKKEYFSSRLLALSIAERLKRGFIEKPMKPIGEMIALAIKGVKDAWIEIIDLLPAEEKLLLKNNIENKNYPECATTLLIAQLSINGDFTAYRSGDSKMLLFGLTVENELKFIETTLERKNDLSNDRIFFRIRLNDQEKFDIINNNPLNEIIFQKNINTIITFSDGIGMGTEQLLIEEYKTAPDQTRNEIIYRSQETGDDKSICFIEIKETGNL